MVGRAGRVRARGAAPARACVCVALVLGAVVSSSLGIHTYLGMGRGEGHGMAWRHGSMDGGLRPWSPFPPYAVLCMYVSLPAASFRGPSTTYDTNLNLTERGEGGDPFSLCS